MARKKPPQNRRLFNDRRQRDRRNARRRLRTLPVAVERRAGEDRRSANRRGPVRRAADTFSARKKILERSRRSR